MPQFWYHPVADPDYLPAVDWAKGDVVELWAADEALGNETMQLMLGEAERM